MNLPIFALFNRALRLESRSLLGYVCRIIVLWPILFSLFLLQHSSISAAGLRLFAVVSWINFIIITLVGIGYFPLAITEEKEIDSLGLLRISGLSPLAIILGKSLPRVLWLVSLLAIQLPFIMLAVSLGGVSVRMIFSIFLSLFSYIVLLNGFGLFCSLICKKNATATAIVICTFLLVAVGASLGVNVLIPFFDYHGWVGVSKFVESIIKYFYYSLPPMHLVKQLSVGATAVWSHQIADCFLTGVMFMVVSWLSFDFFVRETGKPSAKNRDEMAKADNGKRVRGILGNRKCWNNGIVWKDFYFLYGGKVSVIVKVLSFIVAVLFVGKFEPNWGTYIASIAGGFCVIIVIITVLEMMMICSSMISKERQKKTLSLLLLLPQTTWEFLVQKFKGMLVTIAPNIILVAISFAVYCFWGDVSMDNLLENYQKKLLLIAIIAFIIGWTFIVSLYVKRLQFGVSIIFFWLLANICPIPPNDFEIVGVYIIFVLLAGMVLVGLRRIESLASEN